MLDAYEEAACEAVACGAVADAVRRMVIADSVAAGS